MPKSFKTYLLLIAVLIFFWLNGSIIDAALWTHESYNMPDWFVRNLSIFWLVFSQALAPLLIVIILKPKWNSVIAFFAAGCWGGLLWDLVFRFLTDGVWVADMRRWFDLGDLGFVIGFVGIQVWIFHIARLLAGAVLLVWLYRRTKQGEALVG